MSGKPVPPDPNEGLDTKPCFHMHGMLSGLSDGTLTGIRRWYAERHVAGCRHCAPALSTLLVIETRLRALRATRPEDETTFRLDDTRRQAAEDGWNAIDSEMNSLSRKK